MLASLSLSPYLHGLVGRGSLALLRHYWPDGTTLCSRRRGYNGHRKQTKTPADQRCSGKFLFRGNAFLSFPSLFYLKVVSLLPICYCIWGNALAGSGAEHRQQTYFRAFLRSRNRIWRRKVCVIVQKGGYFFSLHLSSVNHLYFTWRLTSRNGDSRVVHLYLDFIFYRPWEVATVSLFPTSWLEGICIFLGHHCPGHNSTLPFPMRQNSVVNNVDKRSNKIVNKYLYS